MPLLLVSSFHSPEILLKRVYNYRNCHSFAIQHRNWKFGLNCCYADKSRFTGHQQRRFSHALCGNEQIGLNNNIISTTDTIKQPLQPLQQPFSTASADCHSSIALQQTAATLSDCSVLLQRKEDKERDKLARNLKSIFQIGSLFKWKLSLWIALSTLPGYLVSGTPISCVFVALAFGTFLTSGGANAFNQVIERDRDAMMARTRTRLLPTGRMTPEQAMKIGVIGSLAGVGTLWVGTNPLTACLGAFNIGLYALVYTPLKTVTPYNVHVGSIVGSIPTIMGCTAAGASLLTLESWMFFTIQALWQFPHFYGLAWRYRQDYLNGGYKSFPLSDPTGHQTAKMIEPYLIATAALPFITTLLDITNIMFVIDGSFFNFLLWNSFRSFQQTPSNQTAKSFFYVSLWHLLVTLFLAVLHSRSLCKRKTTEASATPADNCLDLHKRIGSLREQIQEFCLHKQFNGLSCTKDLCIYDRMAKLTSARFSE